MSISSFAANMALRTGIEVVHWIIDCHFLQIGCYNAFKSDIPCEILLIFYFPVDQWLTQSLDRAPGICVDPVGLVFQHFFDYVVSVGNFKFTLPSVADSSNEFGSPSLP